MNDDRHIHEAIAIARAIVLDSEATAHICALASAAATSLEAHLIEDELIDDERPEQSGWSWQ